MKDLSGVQGICMYDSQFRYFFDNIKNEILEKKRSDHAKLCMERVFVEKKLINPKYFKVDTRSKYVRNCGQVRKSLEETKLEGFEGLDKIFGMASEEVWECVKRRSLGEMWNTRIEAFNYMMSHEGVSQDERDELQRKYFEFIRLKSRAPYECIERHL